jgi:hypothetical protein
MSPDELSSAPGAPVSANPQIPAPPALPDEALGLESFPELLEWLLGTRYREWAVSTYHPTSSLEAGERPSCALMAKVLLRVGPLPGSTRGMPIESTYADALQQLRTRSARRLPEECLERTLLSLRLDDDVPWRDLLTEKATEWDSGKAFRRYRKDVVERAIEATDGPSVAAPRPACPPAQTDEFLTLPLGFVLPKEPQETVKNQVENDSSESSWLSRLLRRR